MTKKFIDYTEQYKHPKWQKLRLKILQRDYFACQKCGDDESELHVHHKRYVHGKKIWEYNEDDLVTLCKECHEEEKDLIKEALTGLIENLKISFFANEINSLNRIIGHALFQCKYPPEVLLNALSWVIESKFDENIMNPYWNWINSKGTEKNG